MNAISPRRVPIVFPPNPTIGDQFTAPSGIVYEWDGTVWMVAPAAFTEVDPLALHRTGGTMTGAIILPAPPPTVPEQVTHKSYVDQLIAQVVGLTFFIGAMDASTPDAQCVFTVLSGIPNGPLPAANTVARGAHLIVTVGGTPTTGPVAGITFVVGDWVISDGTNWSRLAFGGVTGAYLPLTGGTLSGNLTFGVDGQGVITAGGGRFYKTAGAGVRIRESSGGQQPQIEDNNGANVRDIIDVVNGDARYVNTAGDTMTGNLTVRQWLVVLGNDNQGALYMNASTNAAGVIGPWLISRDSTNNEFGRTWWDGPGWNNRWEARHHFGMNMGGYGWSETMRINTYTSGGQLYVTNEVSCNSMVQRSARAGKHDIRPTQANEVQAAWDQLTVKRFIWNDPPPPVDDEGNLLSEPVPYVERRLKFGFIADEMPEDLIRYAAPGIPDPAMIEGYDVAQLLALTVAKLKNVEAELTKLRTQVRRLR